MIIEVILLVFIFITLLLISSKIWGTLRRFHNNNTYLDFFFISLYFLEQFSFLVLYYTEIYKRELWVGLIVLSVITTASLDKLMMYSRHKYLKEIITNNLVEKQDLLNTIHNQSEVIESQDLQIEAMDDLISHLK